MKASQKSLLKEIGPGLAAIMRRVITELDKCVSAQEKSARDFYTGCGLDYEISPGLAKLHGYLKSLQTNVATIERGHCSGGPLVVLRPFVDLTEPKPSKKK